MYKLTMLKVYQQTISRPITFEGIGLHTGKKSKIRILPSTEDKGIVFKRIDIKGDNLIKANYKNVKSTYYCTEISNEFDVSVLTIEHLLAAIFGANIDNVEISIDGPEVPILDGSAKEFYEKILEIRLVNQKVPQKIINIKKKNYV